MSTKLKGLLVSIMGDDSTNGGVTSGKKMAILVGSDIPRIFEVSEEHPAMKIIKGAGTREHIAVPYDHEERSKGVIGGMFGGHFIYCSDSRFPYEHPIHVHDRYETQEEYDALSR